jgi:hypothetical protein
MRVGELSARQRVGSPARLGGAGGSVVVPNGIAVRSGTTLCQSASFGLQMEGRAHGFFAPDK